MQWHAELEVQTGGKAKQKYMRMLFPGMSADDRQQVRVQSGAVRQARELGG
jgi:hypothetical protein